MLVYHDYQFITICNAFPTISSCRLYTRTVRLAAISSVFAVKFAANCVYGRGFVPDSARGATHT